MGPKNLKNRVVMVTIAMLMVGLSFADVDAGQGGGSEVTEVPLPPQQGATESEAVTEDLSVADGEHDGGDGDGDQPTEQSSGGPSGDSE